MSESPFIPFYTSDFLGGTGGMTASTKGVYITLLCLIYEQEGPLSQRWEALARRCGCTLPAFKRAVSDLQDDGKIDLIDGMIWSSKCEKHMAQRRERSISAKAAAEKRWQKAKENQCEGDANALRGQCKPEPEPEIDTNVSIVAASPAKTKRRKPSKQMPDDWTPDQATALRLKDQHNLTNDDLQFCYEQFRDDAHAKDKRFADWNRAFATWVRNSVNWGQIGPGSKRRGNQVNGTGSAFY